jgi:protein TonB
MKRKKNLLSLMLCISLALHGALFFLVPAYSIYNSRLSAPEQSTDPFALVNLALMEPAAPEPPPLRPPEPSRPPPPVLSETLPEDPAETFIPVAELTPVNLDLSPPMETSVAGSAADAPASPAGPSSGDAGDTATLSAAYVKRNYNYIQSRIREKLVYPAQARRAGLQGSAEISFIIHEDGRISNVLVISSSGSESLDNAAVEAIYAASPFRPPPAEARLVIPVTFRLR